MTEPEPREPARAARLLRLALLLLITGGVVGCDHATKMAAKANLDGAPALNVVELRYTENPDIAFSLLERLHIPHSPMLLAGVAIVAILLSGFFLYRSGITKGSRLAQVGLAIALAGGLGNVADRVLRGSVVDFIHVKGWPVFNVADIAVVVGMLLVGFARSAKPKHRPAERESMS